jgi:hypothetical protein
MIKINIKIKNNKYLEMKKVPNLTNLSGYSARKILFLETQYKRRYSYTYKYSPL